MHLRVECDQGGEDRVPSFAVLFMEEGASEPLAQRRYVPPAPIEDVLRWTVRIDLPELAARLQGYRDRIAELEARLARETRARREAERSRPR